MLKYRLFFFGGLLLLILILADVAWWIANFTETISYEENTQKYLSRFPSFLQNARLTTVIEIGILSIALVGFWKSKQANYLRKVAVLLFALTSVVLFWLLFTLM